jgi:hypothetical protein
VLVVAGCTVLSIAQRRLSSAARELRRRTARVEGVRERTDGSSEPITLDVLLGPLDGALAMLSLGVPLLAGAVLAVRL